MNYKNFAAQDIKSDRTAHVPAPISASVFAPVFARLSQLKAIHRLSFFSCTALIATIRLYQLFISPVLGNNCRFYPSCSTYAAEALEQHGLIRGIRLAFLRIIRCNPWSLGGEDPVPPNVNFFHKRQEQPHSHGN